MKRICPTTNTQRLHNADIALLYRCFVLSEMLCCLKEKIGQVGWYTDTEGHRQTSTAMQRQTDKET